MILKIPFNRRKFEREVRALRLLENKLPVPRILDLYDGADEPHYALLLSYIDGASLSGNVTEEIAQQMGVHLACMHAIPTKKFFTIDEVGERDLDQVWIEHKRQAVEESIRFCEQVMSRDKLNQCLRLFDSYFSHFPQVDGPCLVHNDFRMGNILAKGGKVVGVIDLFYTLHTAFTRIAWCVQRAKTHEAFYVDLFQQIDQILRTQ